jgi:hypothetical protein
VIIGAIKALPIIEHESSRNPNNTNKVAKQTTENYYPQSIQICTTFKY